MSTSPNLLTKCSIRLRRICVVWEFINGAVTCTLNVTCTLDPAFKKRHFLGNFPQNSEKKNSKASYQTVPVTKSNLGLQLVFHDIVVFIRSVRKPKRNCSIRSMEFPKSKDYSFIKWYHFFNTFTQMITPEKILRFKAFRKKKSTTHFVHQHQILPLGIFHGFAGQQTWCHHWTDVEALWSENNESIWKWFNNNKKKINWKTELLRQLNTKFTGKQFMVR